VDEPLPGAIRRDRIARLIQERGFVRVAELSRIFRISPVTIRTDLDELETLDFVRRVHGGAVPTSGTAPTAAASEGGPKAKAKAAIGAVAASLVESGQTVVLAGGTTTQAVGRALAQRNDLSGVTVVTNGLHIALELQPAIPRFTLMVTGGTLRRETPSLVDPLADLLVQDITADIAIVGCKGISPTGGVTDDHFPGVSIARRLLQTGRLRVIVADASKVGATSVARFWNAEDIDMLITERTADPEILEQLGDLGVKVQTVQ
jgi:DeoR family transcriptional regulator of aga operon